MKKTWADLDEARKALGTLSRADLVRRSGISESTFTKGLASGGTPQKSTRNKVELVLEAERRMVEAGLR